MSSPSVDVLLATYNGARHLEAQIESILRQEDVALRILVRDDASADGTLTIIERFRRADPDRFVQMDGADKLGVTGNFAHLLRESRAPYAALSDQDDIWFPHKLRTLLNAMRDLEARHGERTPILVHSDLAVVDEALRVRHPSFWRYSGFDPRGSTLSRLLIKNTVTGCASLVNRALVDLALPIPPAALLHDYWLALLAAAAGRIGLIEEPLVAYRQHDENTVGARSYRWNSIIRRFVGTLRTWDIGALRLQAAALAERTRASLTPEARSMITDFVNLPGRNWLERRRVLWRHGILMPGVMRNVALFACVRLDR